MYRLLSVVCLALTGMPCLAADLNQKEIPGWGTAVDPDGDCRFDLKDAALTITAPGPVHDLSAELRKMNAPRVLRSVKGDFVVEVLVKGEFRPGEATIPVRTAYHGAGLVLMGDDQTYIRLDRATLVRAGISQHYANFELRYKGKLTRFGTPVDYSIDPARDTFLRLERKGNTVYGAVCQQSGQWFDLGSKEAELPEGVFVGVAAINASTQPFKPVFEQLKIRQAGDEAEPSPSDIEGAADTETEGAEVKPSFQADSAVQKSPSTKAIARCHNTRSEIRFRHRIWQRWRVSAFASRRNTCTR